MLAVSVLCLTILGCLVCTTDAALSAWTTPSITGKDGSASINFAENPAAAATVVTFAVTGAVGALTYTIVEQPTTAKLEIVTTALKVASGKTFDYETEKTYILKVKVVDAGDSAATGTGTATLTLSITNVNEAPAFTMTQYSATIPDGSKADTVLMALTATDVDANDAVTYPALADTDWKISSSGVISVNTGVTLSQATKGGYSLIVKAADGGTPALTGSATVWIAVKTCTSGTATIISSVIILWISVFAACLTIA